MPVLTSAKTEEGIAVDMAEIKVSSRLTDRLVAYGLGACIGLCIYDPILRIAGLAHIVLPNAQGPGKPVPSQFVGKYADVAVPTLVADVCRNGGERRNLVAAIAGGAHIFSALGSLSSPSRLEIGARNIQAVVEALMSLGIPVVAQDVGGSHGRTLTLKACDGSVYVQPIGSKEMLLACLGKSG